MQNYSTPGCEQYTFARWHQPLLPSSYVKASNFTFRALLLVKFTRLQGCEASQILPDDVELPKVSKCSNTARTYYNLQDIV